MKAIRLLRGLAEANLLGRDLPIAVTLALTYRCNLRCRYCQIWKAAGREMTTRQVLSAITELAGAGMCRLGLTGGEPLLREDVDAIVDHARGLGLFTTLFTNGKLVRSHLGTLQKLDAVLISLDGPREKHDAMRGRGAFDHAFRAIQLLSAEGVKVWTNTVVTSRNLDVVDFVLDLARRYGAHSAFQPVFEHSYSVSAEKVRALRPDQGEYERLVDHLLRRKGEGAPVLNSSRSLRILRGPREEASPRGCLAARAYAAVSPEGRVAPCPVLLQREGLPDGTLVGFVEAFRRLARPFPCKGCFCFATLENDLLLSLDPVSVGNTLEYLVRQGIGSLKERLLPGPRPKGPVAGAFQAAVMDLPDCLPGPCADEETGAGHAGVEEGGEEEEEMRA